MFYSHRSQHPITLCLYVIMQGNLARNIFQEFFSFNVLFVFVGIRGNCFNEIDEMVIKRIYKCLTLTSRSTSEKD